MKRLGIDISSAAIDIRVRELVARERTLTFTALTTALSDCRWISLFRALNRLEKQRVIRLIPLPWDYQICLATGTAPTPGTD
jgi:hypothetical protein